MKQHSKQNGKPPVFVTSQCNACGGMTRLVKLEPAASDARVDLCTYECLSCGRRHTDEQARPSAGQVSA